MLIVLNGVALRVFLHSFSKLALARWDELSQTLEIAGANESFGARIQIGTARRKLHALHAGEGFRSLPQQK